MNLKSILNQEFGIVEIVRVHIQTSLAISASMVHSLYYQAYLFGTLVRDERCVVLKILLPSYNGFQLDMHLLWTQLPTGTVFRNIYIRFKCRHNLVVQRHLKSLKWKSPTKCMEAQGRGKFVAGHIQLQIMTYAPMCKQCSDPRDFVSYLIPHALWRCWWTNVAKWFRKFMENWTALLLSMLELN